MEENKKINKPSYEELKNYCDSLFNDNKKLLYEINQVNAVLNKLPFLFKVLELKDNFNAEFVTRCAKEIEDIMTPAPEEEETEK